MAEMGLVDRFERLGFSSETALRLLSVLMWLQRAVEMPDLLSRILSMEDGVFSAVAKEVVAVLGFLSGQDSDPASPSLSLSNLQTFVAGGNGSISIPGLLNEKDRVRASVDATFKVLSRAKGKAKEGVGRSDLIQSPSQQRFNARKASQGHHHDLTLPSSSTSVPMGQSPGSHLNHAAPSFVPVTSINRGPEDERCLYLTFSKGHPLTSSEIAGFFREMCNKIGGWRKNPRVVETVYVHTGEDQSTALFGKVVFCNPYLPGFFLEGKKETKFIVNGKALWCKKFVPKSIRNNLTGDQGESSQVRGTHGGEVGPHFQGSGGSHFVRPEFVGIGIAPGWPGGQFQAPIGIRGGAGTSPGWGRGFPAPGRGGEYARVRHFGNQY